MTIAVEAGINRTAFLITIDTEGDNMWSRPREIRTENSRWLPRFQALCEKYSFRPTWLTNYEMAGCPVYQEFAGDVLRRGTGEIGMHLHAWNSPPIAPLTNDDYHWQPYLIEYPEQVISDKIDFLTDLLEDQFQCDIVSHRAGRWAFDEVYARHLARRGYRVDCSVTPFVSWKGSFGNPAGTGGVDYTGFPDHPYLIDLENIKRSGVSELLEIPMTTRPVPYSALVRQLQQRLNQSRNRFLRGASRRCLPGARWLRPDGRGNVRKLTRLVDDAVDRSAMYVEFMLHSSEFMPGGSPRFDTESKIEQLYEQVEQLFEHAASKCTGMTLNEFREWFPTGKPKQVEYDVRNGAGL